MAGEGGGKWPLGRTGPGGTTPAPPTLVTWERGKATERKPSTSFFHLRSKARAGAGSPESPSLGQDTRGPLCPAPSQPAVFRVISVESGAEPSHRGNVCSKQPSQHARWPPASRTARIRGTSCGAAVQHLRPGEASWGSPRAHKRCPALSWALPCGAQRRACRLQTTHHQKEEGDRQG